MGVESVTSELAEDVESGLEFGTGVAVAGAGGDFDAALVKGSRFIELAERFVGAAAVEVGGGVVGVVLEESVELADGGFALAGVEVGHGEAVTGEGIGGVLGEHRR